MHFHQSVVRKACSLELFVNVARKHERAQRLAGCSAPENCEARVRLAATIEHEPMAVKPPRLLRIGFEPAWIGQIDERQLAFAEERICFPESFVAAKVRQA